MAGEDKNQAKAGTTEEVISLEDIDNILETDDPQFATSLKEMAKDEDLKNANIDPVSVDGSLLDSDEEAKAEEKLTLILKIKLMIKNFSQGVKIGIRQRINSAVFGFITFLRIGVPDRWRYVKGQVGQFLINISATKKSFKAQPAAVKGKILLLIALSFGVGFLIKLNIEGGFLPSFETQLLRSFELKADRRIELQIPIALESFYGAFPQPEFDILLKKIVVSLKRDDLISAPFGYFEFYLNVDSQETAVEIKDREVAIRDAIHRVVEEFTHDELDTTIGKNRMRSAIKARVNEILNQGFVNRVYIKSIVLKP